MDEAKLTHTLKRMGPSSAKAVCAELGISQSTFSNTFARLKGSVEAIGSGRGTTYVVPRKLNGLGSRIPLFQISEKGDCNPAGELLACEPRGYVFLPKDAPYKIFPGIPYFLADMRPQGFLGRSFAERNKELLLPSRLTDWNEDHSMLAMAMRGEDSPGNWILGEGSLQRYFRWLQIDHDPCFSESEKLTFLGESLNQALKGSPGGSSAAGEQPKFTANYADESGTHRSLIKFSPLMTEPVGRRWADLLVAEAIALNILKRSGTSTSRNQVSQVEDRTFLEIVRFDRVGGKGRLEVISLDALDSEWFGFKDNWTNASTRLLGRKAISKEDAATIRFLDCFGGMIANSDRHFGNLSFFFDHRSERATLAPVYDMLPMLYAPVNGQIVERRFEVPPPHPNSIEEWRKALPIAKTYWDAVAKDSRISQDFRDQAQANLEVLERVRF
ncbi:MAG: type II toxin-antitoxin system HipA family toxin YjjJ [Bdellovibrionales bacterium]|nr:type II toxin-antitoxin system HipA family toxin YjjJ [Bdellovibrionales bacterium]